MKISFLLFCLALVPFALAQAPVTQEEVDTELTWFGQLTETFSDFWEDVTGNIDKERIIEDSKATLNQGLGLVEDSINNVIDAFKLEDNDAQVKTADFPSADDIFAEIQSSLDELREKVQRGVEDIQSRFRGATEQEQEQEQEPVPLEENVEEEQEFNFWDVNNWFSK